MTPRYAYCSRPPRGTPPRFVHQPVRQETHVTALSDFLQHLAKSCENDSFVRLALSTATDETAAVQRIHARLVELQGALHLSFTLREERRDTTQNLSVREGLAFINKQLRGPFRSAMLATTAADWQLQSAAAADAKLIRHRASETRAPRRTHDTEKPTFLGEAAQPFLKALSIVDDHGRPRPKLADKHAQIDRFTEILFHLAQDCGFGDTPSDSKPLRFVDVGCGKGHLTFAAWHLGKNVLQREVLVIGVEERGELVAAANALAKPLCADSLQFVRGDIQHVELPAMDGLIALHACNTATDHAIRRGIAARSKLIVVAPCCHQEVRPQLAAPEPLSTALRHGILAERMAEWATDALRTMVLEWAGYKTKAIEFVSTEHTGKNLMLAGVRIDAGIAPEEQTALRAKIDAFRAFFGIGTHALDAVLDPART